MHKNENCRPCRRIDIYLICVNDRRKDNPVFEDVSEVNAKEDTLDIIQEHSMKLRDDVEDYTKYMVEIDTSNIKETYLSQEIQDTCVEIGNMYGICPEFIMAIIESESSGNPFAENGGCKGLMQVYVKYHEDRMERLGVTDIFDIKGNILVGVDYLAELFEKYVDPAMVLMVYNGDSSAWTYWNSDGNISKYAEKILKRSEDLERLHGK